MGKALYKYNFLALIFLLTHVFSPAQKPQGFKVKKPEGELVFYQAGQKRDSIGRHEGNKFVMIIPEGLKRYVHVFTENAQLIATENDSTFQLNFIRGIGYESYYSLRVQKGNEAKWEFITLVNGASPQASLVIKIGFVDVRDQSILLNNLFYYKE